MFLLEIIVRQWHENTEGKIGKPPRKREKKSEGKEVEQIEVQLTLTTLKPIHAKWLVDFSNHMTTLEGEQVISRDWSTAGMTNALKNGETCLEPLNLFADIYPLVRGPSVE